jgi:hypothetical protein
MYTVLLKKSVKGIFYVSWPPFVIVPLSPFLLVGISISLEERVTKISLGVLINGAFSLMQLLSNMA